MSNTHFLVILSDGETFSGIEGAKIVEVNDEVLDVMQNDAKYRWIANGERGYDLLKSGILREYTLGCVPRDGADPGGITIG